MQNSRAERHGGPPAGNEPGHSDELTAAPGELPLGPLEGLLALLPAEDRLHRPRAEAPAEQIGRVVAEERAERGRDDDERKVHPAGRRHDAGRDDRGLAGHDRQQRVKHRQRQDDRVSPSGRVGDYAQELVKHGLRDAAVGVAGLGLACWPPNTEDGRARLAHAARQGPRSCPPPPSAIPPAYRPVPNAAARPGPGPPSLSPGCPMPRRRTSRVVRWLSEPSGYLTLVLTSAPRRLAVTGRGAAAHTGRMECILGGARNGEFDGFGTELVATGRPPRRPRQAARLDIDRDADCDAGQHGPAHPRTDAANDRHLVRRPVMVVRHLAHELPR